MRKFTGHSRDIAISRSASINKGVWFGALAAIVGLAGVVAKINPGKPFVSKVVSNPSHFPSNSYNVTGATLSAPPSVPISPSSAISSGSSASTSNASSVPPVSASGGS